VNIFLNLINIFLIGLISLALFSCALIQPTPENLNADIELWLEQNEFDKIDKAFNKIPVDDARYQSAIDRKSLIDEKRKNFIQSASESAKNFQQQDKWQQALNTYDDALNKIHDQPVLSQGRADLILERDAQIDTLKKDMMMQRANALISYKKIYDKLLALIPEDRRAQQDIHHYNKNRLEVAQQLNMCGEQARKNKQYLLASDCYALSNQLEPTQQKQLWITSINKQLIRQSTRKSSNELLTAYLVAYNKHEYKKAQQHLKTLLAADPSHEKTRKLLASLNNEISEMALKKINAGKTLYNKKKIDEALKVWQQALLLEPDNDEIIELINRAKKVSKKIQSLEKNQ